MVNLVKQQLIDKDMAIVVEQVIFNKQFKQLWLGYNKITSAGALILSEALKNNNTLEELELQDNQVSDHGVWHFANVLSVNNNTLKKLVLGNNAITDEGVKYLAQMLQSNRTLTFLGLSNNSITHQGLQILVNSILNYNTILQKLILTGNGQLTDASENALLQLIKQSQSLTLLHVTECGLSLPVKNKLNQAGCAKTGLHLAT
jgi:Ran GTPase-activating protein (RanGAP) involved in mRNA processing and transport